MTSKEELELIIKLIGKYDLPLSPILEYAIREKIEEIQEPDDSLQKNDIGEGNISQPILNKTETRETVNPQSYENNRDNLNQDFIIFTKANNCYIINKYGETVFSSTGKLKRIEENFYRIKYTYSSISINLVIKDSLGEFVLGERIIHAPFRSLLYSNLDEQNYLEQIKSVKIGDRNDDYQIEVDNKWYDYSGNIIDINKSGVNYSSIEEPTPNSIIIENTNSILIPNIRIKEYSNRSIAVIGDTKPYKDDLRAMGGFYLSFSKWGPAWIYPINKRDIIQKYIEEHSSLIPKKEEEIEIQAQKRHSWRYKIRVEYPDGRIFCSNYVWETLVDVIKYAGPKKVNELNIKSMGGNLVSSSLHDNIIYRKAQKQLKDGLYVSTFSSTDTKYKQIVKINKALNLGLIIDKVYDDEIDIKGQTDSCKDTVSTSPKEIAKKDKRIGYKIKMFPSQKRGKIIDVKKGSFALNKLIIKTEEGKIIEIDDMPFLYQVLK